MEKCVYIKTDESEVLELVNEHFKHLGVKEYSIVATQELGNEDWVVTVSPYEYDFENFIDLNSKSIKLYHFTHALDRMCFDGILEPGEYVIDCTW